MYHHLRRTFGVTLCLLGLASPLVCAAAPPSTPSPAAQLVAVQGASHPYRLMDYDHRVITAAVPRSVDGCPKRITRRHCAGPVARSTLRPAGSRLRRRPARSSSRHNRGQNWGV